MNTTKTVAAIVALSLGLGNVAFAQTEPHPGPGDMDPRRLEHPDGRIRGQAREAPRAPHRGEANNHQDRREQARQEQDRQSHARQEQARHEHARQEHARQEQARHEQARHEQLRRQQAIEQARIERERQAQLARQHQRDDWRRSRDHGYDRSDFQGRRFQEGHYDGRHGDRRYEDIRYQERWSHDDRRWNQHWARGAGPQHNLRRGDRLPVYYRNYNYVVHDWQGHRLRPPPVGYQWVQTGGDYVLVAIATGVILSLLLSN